MEPNMKAFDGIFIRVEDVSTDLTRYLGISADYLNNVGKYLNVYKYFHEDTWTYTEATVGKGSIVAADRPIANTSQEVFAFIFDCDLES